MLRQLTLGLIFCAALSGCGGGGSTGPAVPPVRGIPPTSPQRIKLSISIPAPQKSGASTLRRPLYVSVNTQSAAIAVNGGSPVVVDLAAGSLNCVPAGGGRTCTASVDAPVGTDTFTESLYASTDGTGTALSQSATSATIVAGQANVVNLVLDGVVASLGMALADANPPVGTKQVIGLTVNFNDASGAAIIGNDPFANPIALTDSDKSKIITILSKTTLNSPADAVNLTVTYNGQPLSSAVFGASAAGGASASVTMTPQQAAVVFNDYTMFGYDSQHDVFNPNTTAITPTSVSNLHLAWQTLVGGAGDYSVQSQPILATEIPNHAGVLFVGGGSGHVAAHDALSGALLWRIPTGQIVYTCGPGQPQVTFGIGGTAAYDPATRSVYIVANKNSTLNGFAQNELLRLDAATGTQKGSVDFGAGQVGTGTNELNFSHTAVTLSNGIAYVGTGATCDISSWRGRVAAINVASMSLAANFFTLWNPPSEPYGGGGIWGWGGVSLDFNGNVLTGVGNADNGISNGQIVPPFKVAPQEYSGNGESVLQLSGDLSQVIASNHPIPLNVYNRQVNDLDLNGTPAIFKPLGTGCDTMAALQSKSGQLFIYDTTRIGSGPSAQYQLAPGAFADGFLGDPAFSAATGLLYAVVASSQSPTLFPPGMIAIDPGCGTPAVTWHATFGPDSTGTGVPRSVPAVSAGGVVFVATACDALSGVCAANGNFGALWELSASDGTVLNGGKPVLYTNAPIRAPATIDGNWVYVVDIGGDFYGLTIDPNFAKIAATRRSVQAQQPYNRTNIRSFR